MVNDYKSDQRINKYVEANISKMQGIDERLKPIIKDIMLRRFFEFGFGKKEMDEDIASLVNNLRKIEIAKMPKEYSNAAGLYSSAEGKITINKQTVLDIDSQEKAENLYETLTHEVYHALANDKYGAPKISGVNRATRDARYNCSLEEAIVEKAADRCVFGRKLNEKNAPFFHQNKYGYSDITFITDIIEATYGVTEKAFLRHAIQGRKNVAEFLGNIAEETPENAYQFLDRIEIGYGNLHKVLYPWGEPEKSETEKANIVKSSVASSLMLSAWKFNENIEKLDMNSNDFESKVADYKYSYDKLFIVTREVAEYYGNRSGSDVKEYILNSIKQEREGNAFRVNTLSEILSQKDNIPDEEFKKLVETAKKGQREFEGENLFEKYQISQETPEFISLERSKNEGFIRMDFGLTEWDNSELSSMASILRDVYKAHRLPNFFKSIKENFKKFKEGYVKLFSNDEPLKELGPGEDKTVLPNKSENFVSLTPEAMQKFRRGEKEVLQAHRETEIKIAENPEINKNNNPEIDDQEL